MVTASTVRKNEWLSQEIRQEIILKKLSAGYKLPTESELMVKYRVSQATVAHAMKRLEKQGYVYRRIGSGTFVQDKTKRGEIAILADGLHLNPESMPCWHLIVSYLRETIQHRNPKWRGRIHVATVTEAKETPSFECDLMDAHILENLAGVFSLLSFHPIADELEQRGIPAILISEYNPYHFPNQVSYKINDIYCQAFKHLAEVGCKTVAVTCEGPQMANANNKFLDFVDPIKESGLECRPEWMVGRSSLHKTEKGGWELFHQLWREENHPDALFVDDDLNFRGVVRAALELGVRFPEDIRVVTITPRGVPIPYHKPVTVVEFDTQLLARTAMDLMEKLIRREEPTARQIFLPVQLVKGQTT